MYPNNNNKSVNPHPPAYNYGAANGNNDYYQAQDYSGNTSNITGNGGLYDDFSLNAYSSTKIRHGFIKKVYSLLTIQLLFTFGASALAVLWPAFNKFLISYYILFIILSLVLTLPIIIYMACVPSSARKSPTNYILLFIVTFGLTCSVSVTSAFINSPIVFYAIATTMGVTIGLTLFAFQTKYDFTGWYVYIFVALLIFLILGIIGIFVENKIFNLVKAGIGALIFSFAIIIDTQMIVGGKHKKYQYSIDDYVFATLTLYMDIINLFIQILSIFSNAQN